MSIENTQAESHDPKQGSEGMDGSPCGLTGSEASPRPWRAFQANESVWCIADADNNTVQHIADHRDGADTAYIVQAVNAYDSLVGALRLALVALEYRADNGPVPRELDALDRVRAALSQVPDSRGGAA